MEPIGWGSIFARMFIQFWPVWVALIITYAASIHYRRRLGLYGKLFDSTVGMIGFGIVMFWVYTAFFADIIITHDPLGQLSGMKNKPPGTPAPDGSSYAFYLLGGDNLARDVFSRVVMGARRVLAIAPAATLFAFMVGITLGLPAGYFAGKLDTGLSFLANLVLAFPVILLFYLLVTPEIRDTGIPVVLAAILFIFPIIFMVTLFQSRFFTDPKRRNIYVGITLVIGLWAYSGLAFNADPLGVWSMAPNMLNVFVAVVFVNAPTVFRIVRGIVLDLRSRDYVAAGQTRGEGPWYIMLWEEHAMGNPAQRTRATNCRFLPAHRLHHHPARHARLLRPRRQPGIPRLGLDHQRWPPPSVGLPASRSRARHRIDEPRPGPQPARRRPARRKYERLMLSFRHKYPRGSGGRQPPALGPKPSAKGEDHDKT